MTAALSCGGMPCLLSPPLLGALTRKGQTMTDAQDLQLRWARFSAAVAKANKLNKGIVFGALSAAGITHIAVGFDGEGDQRQIEDAAAFAGDKSADFPTTTVKIYRAHSGCEKLSTQKTSLREAVEELCYAYLEQEHGGWENNDGAFGEFSFHVAERKIELDFNGRFIDYSHSSHTF
jgi:hypothetical protein